MSIKNLVLINIFVNFCLVQTFDGTI